jgi:invasion protein IalB
VTVVISGSRGYFKSCLVYLWVAHFFKVAALSCGPRLVTRSSANSRHSQAGWSGLCTIKATNRHLCHMEGKKTE